MIPVQSVCSKQRALKCARREFKLYLFTEEYYGIGNHWATSCVIHWWENFIIQLVRSGCWCLPAILALSAQCACKMYILVRGIAHLFHCALCLACMRRRSFWMKSVKFSGESQSKSSCTSDSKMEIFPWLSNIYRWRIYLWNVSYTFRKRAHSSKQRVTVRAHAAFLSEPLWTQRFIFADTRNLLTFNNMIARFMFTLLICTFPSKLFS